MVGVLIGIGIAVVVLAVIVANISLMAREPGHLESTIMNRVKYWRVGGQQWTNPIADTPDTVRTGADHFQHHCQICHGLDGQNSGVPFATKLSPPAADLVSSRVQNYTDGQLKWIIENGIRFSGMPGWKGILDDDEMWHIVRYMRHLPVKGSLGVPEVYKETTEEHEHMQASPPHQHKHDADHHETHQ
jgi:mono/diheme cytochrome c family protein